MYNLQQKIIPLFILIVAMGCGNRKTYTNTDGKVDKKNPNYYTQEEGVSSDQTPSSVTESNNGYITDSAAVYLSDESSKFNPLGTSVSTYIGDSSRKFIKTADLKFRVKSAIHATYEIEDLTKKFGGFVTSTTLESRVDGTSLIPVSPDSSLETIYYTVTNSMTLRVPSDKLDSTLRSFSPMVDYLDHRKVVAEDVQFRLLASRLTQERIRNYQKRLGKKVDSNGKYLDEITDTEDALLNRQEQADNAKIENLTLQDQIEFSTIHLNIYQRQAVKREMVANTKNISAYEPGFGYKLQQALKTGWHAFTSAILFFVQFWILFLFAGIGFVIFKMVMARRK